MRQAIEGRIGRARRAQAPGLVRRDVQIVREHGQGGSESRDGIILELV